MRRWPTMFNRDRRGVTHLLDGAYLRWCDVAGRLNPKTPTWPVGTRHAPCLFCVAEAMRAQEDSCRTS